MDRAIAVTTSKRNCPISPEGSGDEIRTNNPTADERTLDGFHYSTTETNPPDDVENATIDDSVVHLPLQAFKDRRKLAVIRFGAGLRIIGRDCFEGCRELSAVDVPDSVTEIRAFAFAGCYNLVDLRLSDRLEIIDQGAFVSCIWLKTVKIPRSIHLLRSHAFSFCIRLTTLELPEGLQTIASKAFRQCISLMTVRIPSTVLIIKLSAFWGCKNLLAVEMAEVGLQRIESRAFKGCEDLRSFYIPSTVTVVPENAFEGCTKLHEALPEDYELFEGCLRNRFERFPIHKLAYFHSFQNVDTVLDSLSSIFSEQDDNDDESPPDTDCFQMSPLHIIALSSKPNLEVALKLVRQYSNHITAEDFWGRLSVIYLCQSAPPNSLQLVQMVAKLILPAILETFHLEPWGRQVADFIGSMEEANDSRARSTQVQRILKLVDKYRTKEKMCLIEWMMWKKKLSQLASDTAETPLERPAKRSRKSEPDETPPPPHRVLCRTLCGADIVISNVAPFLVESE